MAEPHEVPPGRSGEDGDWAAGLARVVGDRWSILAIRAIFRGIRRFDDLQADLGISRGVLTDRLRRLMDAGVVLSPMIVALLRWGSKWVGGTQHGPVLVHKQCGTELEQGFWCRTCRTTFGPLGVGARHE